MSIGQPRTDPIPRSQWYTIGIALCLFAGAVLRFSGIDRGHSDFVPPTPEEASATSAFYAFHPDELMVIGPSLRPIDPFDPPFTVYGLLPVYALRGALSIAGLGSATLDTPEGKRQVYHVARLLAALYSMTSLILVWCLGRRYFSRAATLLALFILALAPGAVQQAHFYIVDGPFLALSLAAIYACVRAVERGTAAGWYLAAGALIGCAGATRLNGLLLGAVLVVLYASKNGWQPLRIARRRELWFAGSSALAVVFLINPYLLTDPLWMLRAEDY